MDRLTLNRIIRFQDTGGCFSIPVSTAVLTLLWSVTTGATTDLQATTEQAVVTVCGGFVQNNDAVTADQQDLFARCAEMVHNSRELDRIPPGPTTNTLGLDNEQLDAAYQQLAAEETIAPGNMATDTANIQTTAILGRIDALRGSGGSLARTDPGTDSPGSRTLVASLNDALTLGLANGTTTLNGDWRRLGIFVNGDFGFGEKDTSDREDGFDYDSRGVTAGVDYRLTEALVLGGAVGYSRLSADFKKSTNVTGGSVDADSYNVFGYGLYTVGGYYVNGLLGYTSTSFDIDRRILYEPAPGSTAEGANRTATADTDGSQVEVSLAGGYDYRRNALTISPELRLDYLNADIDSYRESGAQGLVLQVDDQTIESFTSALGVQASFTTSHSFGALIPQARVEWIHEFSNDGRRIETQYVNDPRNNVLALQTEDPDRNYALIGLGVSAVFQSGMQAFINYETLQGLKNIESHLITAGIRLEM
ncbi:MAG: autotransporter outer membrane beta-barrel domain-containing protein [Ectothiorhodospiraceae bacterium]|jgi:outer membrane autotransporter protein